MHGRGCKHHDKSQRYLSNKPRIIQALNELTGTRWPWNQRMPICNGLRMRFGGKVAIPACEALIKGQDLEDDIDPVSVSVV